MQTQVQVFWCQDVEVVIWERSVGNWTFGYVATFTLNGAFHQVYNKHSTTCWLEACKIIKGEK